MMLFKLNQTPTCEAPVSRPLPVFLQVRHRGSAAHQYGCHPDQNIIAGGGLRPGEKPYVAAICQACEEVRGTLGRVTGIAEHQKRKHRLYEDSLKQGERMV